MANTNTTNHTAVKRRPAVLKRVIQTVIATAAASTSWILRPFPAAAQTVEVTPTSAGLPGAAQIQELINWFGQYALWSGLAAIIAGAAWMGWSFWQGRQSGSKGQMAIVGGGLGALIIAFAPDIINNLSGAGGG